MLDHMFITRNLLAHYRGSEIHNEVLHDESAAFAIDRKYPNPITRRSSPPSSSSSSRSPPMVSLAGQWGPRASDMDAALA